MRCSRRLVLQTIWVGTLQSGDSRAWGQDSRDRAQIENSRERRRAIIVDAARPRAAPRSQTRAGDVLRPADFNMVGQYDIDWLLEPRLQRLLDNMAASPAAFGSVRIFHALDSGTRANTIDDDPLDGGQVWFSPDAKPDFTKTFAALETLTRRGLVPFVGLNFFPKAVAAHAITPPADFGKWKQLIRTFLQSLASDQRFGSAFSDWHFEVWNEPNGKPFWRGAYDPDYFNLYRATSEAVAEAGYPIKLGGPAIVYRAGTEQSRRDMEQFLRFLSDNPAIECDFISLHAKGSWSSEQEPEFDSAVKAMIETAETALAVNAGRFSGLPIINDEADMRVGFNIPYMARMDHRFSAWLCSLMIAYDQLNERFRAAGFRFLSASDNANQQLVRTAFDGRRSIMTRASSSARDLIKLPAFNFYEILRLLGDRHGTTVSGSEFLYPNSQLFHLVSIAETHITVVFTIYPRTRSEPAQSRSIDYSLTEIPWEHVNVAEFRIDATHSNSFAAAQRGRVDPYPASAELRDIRFAQEFATQSPIKRKLALAGGKFDDVLTLSPWATVALWITPVVPDKPVDPEWIETAVEDGNVILHWTPNREPFFYSYELFLLSDREPPSLLSPMPLRSAIWVHTDPAPGVRTYAVQAISASGISSRSVVSAPVIL
jgi:Glycosyl hydrolases family 39